VTERLEVGIFGPYDCEYRLADANHEVLADFTNFITMHIEIHNSNVNAQLQNDPVENLWGSKMTHQLCLNLVELLFVLRV
jgi:hypothetical protein